MLWPRMSTVNAGKLRLSKCLHVESVDRHSARSSNIGVYNSRYSVIPYKVDLLEDTSLRIIFCSTRRHTYNFKVIPFTMMKTPEPALWSGIIGRDKSVSVRQDFGLKPKGRPRRRFLTAIQTAWHALELFTSNLKR